MLTFRVFAGSQLKVGPADCAGLIFLGGSRFVMLGRVLMLLDTVQAGKE